MKSIKQKDAIKLGKRNDMENSEKAKGEFQKVFTKKIKLEKTHDVVEMNDLGNLKEGLDPNNPIRVYADGVFDLFHFGHAKVLEQAKKLFKYTYLIVGINSDQDTLREKGKIVMNENERAESVRHCKWVDEVICPGPWVVTPKFLRERKIKYAAHDAVPYASVDGSSDIYGLLKTAGMFKETQRTEGISTSDLILRILKDYNDYIWRNLQRGYTAKDMNISRFRATTLKLKHTVQNTVQGLSKKIKGKPNKKITNIKETEQNKGREAALTSITVPRAEFKKKKTKKIPSTIVEDNVKKIFAKGIRKYSMEYEPHNILPLQGKKDVKEDSI